MAENWPKGWPAVAVYDKLEVFDPDGDVLLQLREVVVVVDDSAAGEISPVADELQDLESLARRDLLLGAPSHSASLPLVDQNPEAFSQPTEIGEDAVPEGEACQLQLEDDSEPDDAPNVYLRVSSRHLILASQVFSKMLGSDNFGEGNTLRSQGNLNIKLPDDPAALIILMHIVHGKTRKVPRNITLGALFRLAKLVDYYELHEAIEVFSDAWIASLKPKSFPNSFTPELLYWLFISWVFNKGDIFTKTTHILISECDEKSLDILEHETIPVPSSISEEIQEQRIAAIESSITIIHDYITKYLTSKIICTSGDFACDASMLGSLLKKSINFGIWPRPEVPFPGVRFKKLAIQLREMSIGQSCRQNSYSRYVYHGIGEEINASIKIIDDQYRGLKLDEFSPLAQARMEDVAGKR